MRSWRGGWVVSCGIFWVWPVWAAEEVVVVVATDLIQLLQHGHRRVAGVRCRRGLI